MGNDDLHFFIGGDDLNCVTGLPKNPLRIVSFLENMKKARIINNPEKETVVFEIGPPTPHGRTMSITIGKTFYPTDFVVSIKHYICEDNLTAFTMKLIDEAKPRTIEHLFKP